MTSPMLAMLDLIESTLGAIAPVDRPEVLFAHVEGQGTEPGTNSDRVFWFEPASACDVVSFDGVDMTVLEWIFAMRVRFQLAGQSKRDRAKRIATETVMIMRAINTIPEGAFPEGTRGLLCDSVSMDAHGEEMIATYSLKSQTEEVD